MIRVVCGVIYKRDKFLITRRKPGIALEGKWEFPGGKIKDSETGLEALKRELLEELGMQVEVLGKIGSNIHHYPNFSIELIAYKCTFIEASFKLTDHDAYEWISKVDISNFDLADADKPFIDLI
ncbi:(deoxy)nucleoside triphosphate pyrophosphohydrolase [Aestuariivivens marinum]|uniref:(deoxy)nucleoside triphosphate pyrophosphohydrolase n=1 Tax=Aestuariivivens marinum TaxID=2913555 RepID=UPI001F597913|nr:(deoxy)nucleoside triphosphate pyrophosphohydrolase [Aestuariivivens marinum]